MIIPDPGAPFRSPSPATTQYQRAERGSRAAKQARAARFTLDALEHSGTITAAMGGIQTPVVALTSNHSVIFTLNQYTVTRYAARSDARRALDSQLEEA